MKIISQLNPPAWRQTLLTLHGPVWPELQKICTKLFTIATSSSASCERNFSTMGFLHTKLRNRMAVKTVEMMVYIKSNHAAFTGVKAGCYEESDDAAAGSSSSSSNVSVSSAVHCDD